ncbi:MAG: calcium/sodium antiporter [Trueperaceae bacterium]
MSWVLLFVGFALLVLGGDVLVRGAVALAARLRISPLVIGLTVVAFGTSAPELAATLASSLRGVPELGVGNVLGSNVANVALILGAAALLAPIAGNAAFLRREIPVGVGVMALLPLLALDGVLGRWDGLALLAILGAYLTVLARTDRGALRSEGDEAPDHPLWRAAGLAAIGIGLLVLGAEATVRGAVDIATAFGVSERVIGLTVVAFGTSLPELASSLAAAARRQGDMILGNIAGSNVFNVLAVLGASATVTRLPVRADAIAVDVGLAIGASLLLVPFLALQGRLGRLAGGVLLASYAAYLVWAFGSG